MLAGSDDQAVQEEREVVMTVDEKINELIDIVESFAHYAPLTVGDFAYIIERLEELKQVEVTHE